MNAGFPSTVPTHCSTESGHCRATTHGGRLHSTHDPLPEAKAVAANSAGPGNTYKHPLFKTPTEHKENGWPMPIQTRLSGSRPCHVFLHWGKRPQLFHGACDVTAGSGLSVLELIR